MVNAMMEILRQQTVLHLTSEETHLMKCSDLLLWTECLCLPKISILKPANIILFVGGTFDR